MRSGIYSYNHIKTESKGKWWIPAILVLGFLLAFPVAELLKLGNWKEMQYTTAQIKLLYENLWKDGLAVTGAFVMIIAAICNSVSGFRYLYSGSKTDFYHSLPVKRSRMFWQKVYTGFLYVLIPYFVMLFLAVCTGAAKGFFSFKLIAMAVRLMGLHFLIYFLAYFCIVLILCITGNALSGILGCVFVGFYGGTLNTLLQIYRESFFTTFYQRDGGLVSLFAGNTSPGGAVIQLIMKYREGTAGKNIAGILVITVILAGVAFLAYTKRPSEAAGKAVVYNWVAVLLRFMVVVPSGLGIGWIFYGMTATKGRIVWWIFGLILGTVLSHGLMETIYQMDFHGFFKKKIQLVLAGGLVLICALYYQQDLGKYDRYCPKQEDITSVNVGMTSFAIDSNGEAIKNEDGTYSYTENYQWYQPVFALSQKGGGIGEETYKAISQAVEESKEIYNKGDGFEGTAFTLHMKYSLKSGRSVYRDYVVRRSVLRELMKGLYMEENLKEQKYSFLNVDRKYLETVDMTAADWNSHSIYNGDSQEKRDQLMDAIKKDVDSATAEDLLEQPEVRLDLMYSLPGKTDINSMSPNSRYANKIYGYWCVYVYPSFKNTLEILQKTGYPLSVEELDITGITLHYTNLDSEDEESQDVTVEYDSPSEINALKKAMTFTFANEYADTDEGGILDNVTAEAKIKGEENTATTNLLKDKLPDFVKEKMKELGISMDESVIEEQSEAASYCAE